MAKTNGKGMAANGRRAGGQSFAGIPRRVMEHPDYIALSYSAKALLFELAYQYRGKNNGDLTAAWAPMKARGWKSKATLSGALEELLDAGLVSCTRQGRFVNPGGVCSLYALTWQPIDECGGKHDLEATATAPRRF